MADMSHDSKTPPKQAMLTTESLSRPLIIDVLWICLG